MKSPILACATLVLFCIALSSPSSAWAQMGAGQAGAGGADTAAMAPPGAEKAQAVAQVLNLSPQQRSQLEPILKAEAPKVQAINQDPNLTASEKASKLKSVHSESDPLVKSILTPTQYKQWEVIRKHELQNVK